MIPIPLSMGYIQVDDVTTQKDDIDDDDDDENANKDNRQLPPPPQKKECWLVDPSAEEERVCPGRICVVVNAHHPEQIVTLDFQGQGLSMTASAMALAAKMARGRAEEILPLVQPLLPVEPRNDE